MKKEFFYQKKGIRGVLFLLMLSALVWATNYYVSPSGFYFEKVFKIWRIVQILFVLMFFTNFVNATDYYVRPNEGEYGSGDGSNYANAFDGFSNINWANVDAGNGKLFVCGVFTSEQLVIGANGEDGTPILIVNCLTANGASTDDPAVINGQTQQFTAFTGLVDASYKSYIIFDDIEVKNATTDDVYLIRFSNCNNITLKNCLVHDNVQTGNAGVNFNGSSYCLIGNNNIYATGRNAVYLPKASNNVVEYNYIHDNSAHNGIDLHENDEVLYSGNIIRYNEIARCTNGIKSQYQTNHEIYCNLIYEMSKSGIHFCDIGGLGAHTGTCKVYNNTIVDNTWDGIQNDVAKNTTVKNNIFANDRYEINIASAANQGHTIVYNLYGTGAEWRASGTTYTSLSSWYSAQGYDDPSHSFEASPGFADAVNDDYSLDSNSAAIDKGTNLTSEGITEDIEDNDRPQGSGFDIGAYESPYNPETGLQLINRREGLKMSVYPNPSFHRTITIDYELSTTSDVAIAILNETGSLVMIVLKKDQSVGKHNQGINTMDLPPSMYFCKILAENKMIIKKFLLQ